jgi:hypothetical protein
MAGYRSTYKRGATEFLASMKVGEKVEDDGSFNWRAMQSIACRLENDSRLTMKWEFRTRYSTGRRWVTRVQ